tara:strand:+ start:161 stop:889 length:729 start_codon:yes stop_codon:yes gene_type:complete
MLNVLDLFSGIGGFSLGLEATGFFKTKAFCEIDPFCQKVLKKHWPDIPIHDDIRSLKGKHIGTVDIITGGYPCQPFSVAGKQKAEKDPRHLWPEYFRLIKELGQLGLLEKMLMDTLNSVWTPYSRTWKVKITPQGHLVFQLQASVQTTKEKESGLWPTPTTEVANRTTKYKQGGTSLSLAVKLKMWPTPTANEDACGKPTGKMQKMLGNHPEVRKPLNGGTLNPNWVEWLMGYPTGWTDLNH